MVEMYAVKLFVTQDNNIMKRLGLEDLKEQGEKTESFPSNFARVQQDDL